MSRVIALLDREGLTEDTIVIYTSDQGFFLGEHGFFDKRLMYEPCLTTPLLVRSPGHTHGRSSRATVRRSPSWSTSRAVPAAAATRCGPSP